jgi:hypothetical protein
MSIYAALHFVAAMGAGIALLHAWRDFASRLHLFTAIALVVLTLSCIGRLYDRSPSVVALESGRLVLLSVLGLVLFPYLPATISVRSLVISRAVLLATLLAVCALSLLVVRANRSLFRRETRAQWERRVWVPEAGRRFGKALKAAGGVLDLSHITADVELK